MNPTHCTKSTTTTTVPVRLDPLSKSRFAWVSAQFTGQKPSRSIIIRRALECYQKHLEDIIQLNDGERLEFEALLMSRSAQNHSVPWEVEPDYHKFLGKPFTWFTAEGYRGNIQKLNRELFKSDPFGSKARAMEVKR